MKFILLYICLFFISHTLCMFESEQWIKIKTKSEDTNYKNTFHIALKQNQIGVEKLENFLLDHISNVESPLYGNYLTVDEINKMVGATSETIEYVTQWLNNMNISNCIILADNIKCQESINKINDLFDVRMELYHNKLTGSKRYRSNVSYKIPTKLEKYIDFVDGISNPLPLYYLPKINLKINSSDVDDKAFTREVMLRLYNMSDSYTTKNISVGVIEYTANINNIGFSNKDLLHSQNGNGVPPNLVNKEHLIGINYDIPDPESELDIQTVYWGAANSTLWYEAYGGWMYGWANEFFNKIDVPEVISISYGWDETQQCDVVSCENTTSKNYIYRANIEFMKITARGITIVVASGDAGSPGRSNEYCSSKLGPYGWNHINAVFPGGSPWVLSVGGTYLVKSDKSLNFTSPICNDPSVSCSSSDEEIGASYNKTMWTSSGAFTRWNRTPKWQLNNVKDYFNSSIKLPQSQYYNQYGRGYPDVSAVGHNCLVNLMDGTGLGNWAYVDGTSCSAPIFAGIIAQLNYFQKQRGRPVLGFINPLLYKMANDIPQSFNDILHGNTQCTETLCCVSADYCCTEDFGFQASKGWDPVGGLGTPNINEMQNYLSSL